MPRLNRWGREVISMVFLVDSSLNCNVVVSCDPLISTAVSFTPGFSQVARFPRNRKPFKRFPSLM
jgi:hypothetical protein